MSDIYLQITETPTVVTLSAPVISGALTSTVTVANTVTVALDSNSLSALENVTVTVGAAITGTVTVSNFPASQAVTFSAVNVTTKSFLDGLVAFAEDQTPLFVELYNAIPAGTNRIGVVTIGGGTVTIGAGTAQIGSVTASNITGLNNSVGTDGGTPAATNFIKIGGHQDGSNSVEHIVHVSAGGSMKVDASDSTVTFGTIIGTVTIGNTVTIAGTVTANPTGTQTVAGTVTLGAGTAQIGSVTASISNSVTIASLPAISGTVTANLAISSTVITSGSFTSLTSATIVPGNTARKMATVYNLGAGQLFINTGATATTLGGGFMVALFSGDFFECDYTTTTLSAIFATAGTASWISH